MLLQVATLTQYLQSTNEDLISSQKAVEILEVSSAATFPQERLNNTLPAIFHTVGARGRKFPAMPISLTGTSSVLTDLEIVIFFMAFICHSKAYVSSVCNGR